MSQYVRYPTLGGGGITTYANLAAFPASAADGTAAIALDTDNLYIYSIGSSSWRLVGGPGGMLSIGTIDSQSPSADGAVDFSNTLVLQSASATKPGLVNLAAQTFAGRKSISDISAANIYQLSTETIKIDLVASTLTTTGGVLSVDWDNRRLKDSSAAVTLDWQLKQLSSAGNIEMKWGMLSPDISVLIGNPVLDKTGLVVQAIAAQTNPIQEWWASTSVPVAGVEANGDFHALSLTGDGATASTVPYFDASKKLVSSAVTPTQLSYVDATSSIQTQLNAKVSTSLTSAHILVGNVSNVATDVAMSGDISISNAGATAYSGTVPINKGGTGQTTANAGFNALSPMTTLGDLIYGGASGAGTRLAGDTSNTRKFLRELSVASAATAPVWDTLVSGDIPNNAANTTGTAGNGYTSPTTNSTFLKSTAASVTGTRNTVLGGASGGALTSGTRNVIVGDLAGTSLADGNDNVYVGSLAGNANVSGSGIIAIGREAAATSTGNNNIALGLQALYVNTTGVSNMAIGAQSLFSNISGGLSTAVGVAALMNSTGGSNVAIGNSAGATVTSGTSNTLVGTNADVGTGSFLNATALGANSVAYASNSMTLGSSAVNVGIGNTAAPTARLFLPAGTTSAGKSPLKFQAGTNMTSAEAGAVEWDGTNLFISQTTGPTRKTIAYTDSTITGNAANVTGIVALVNGGTGTAAASANAAFNALSPMTTGGDIIYGGASGVATRLANGSSGQFLTSNGTTTAPTWTTASIPANTIVNKTANYTILSTDRIVTVQSAGGAFTLTLPDPSTVSGIVYTVKKTDTSFNAVTIARFGSELWEGVAANVTLNTLNESYSFYSNGTNWFVQEHKTITPWTAYTPTLVAVGTATAVAFAWRRMGSSIHIIGNFITGTCTGAAFSLSLPSINVGLTIDSAVVGLNSKGQILGSGYRGNNAASFNSLTFIADLSITSNLIYASYASAGASSTYNPFSAQVGTALFSNAEIQSITTLQIPITGWSE